ncbi:MAG: hypothetical protein K8I82_23570 [Anaerolineae bacterium]|nr:hypothetical protein [Anaerolineae bacterium]
MTAIEVTASLVRPLHGAVVRRFIAGASVSVGQAVFIASDGLVEPADASAQDSAQARGIVVGVGVAGQTSASSGQAVDVVTHGPVVIGNSSMNEGEVIYISPTAGVIDQTAPAAEGEYPFVVGWAESGTVIYVQPQVIVPTANS